MKKQITIKKKIEIKGIGLHTGTAVKITFCPSEPDTGIIIKSKAGEFKAEAGLVFDTKRGTSLKSGGAVLHTAEHMVSAISGLGIDNIIAEIEGGEEPPAFDGSSYEYVKVLGKVYPSIQDRDKKELIIKEPVVIKDRDKYLAVLPYKGFKVHYFSDFSAFGLKPEDARISIDPYSYSKEIARARTFGFKHEIDTLIKSGLIKGASLKNAILIDNGRPVNTKLRYKDELTRHKILDIVGDFGLLGANLNLLVIAVRTGHTQNIEMAKIIKKQSEELNKN